jgi:hypothetical protein
MRLGYDGIELSGEPDIYTADAVHAVVEPQGLAVTSICGIYTPARDLSHRSREIRDAAVEYVRACAELAAAFGAVALVEPLARVLRGSQACTIREGQLVLIVGAGPIGLLHLQVARLARPRAVVVSAAGSGKSLKVVLEP